MQMPKILSGKNLVPNQGQPILTNQPKIKKEETPIFELVENKKIMEQTFLENQNAKPEVVRNRKKELDGLKEKIAEEKEKLTQNKIKEAVGGDHQYVSLLAVREKLIQEMKDSTDPVEKDKKEKILVQTNVDIGKIESEEIENILVKNFGEKSHFGILQKETKELKAVFEKSKNPLDEQAWQNKDLQKEHTKMENFEWLLIQEEKEEILTDRLKSSRENYAKDDYEKGEKFKKLKKILGVSLKTTPDQLTELQNNRKEYEEAAKNLTSAKLEGIKRRHMGADVDKEEMGVEVKNLLVEMSLKEKLNLLNARTEAINEKWKIKEDDEKKEKWKKNIRNAGVGSIKWYQSLSPKQKMGISVILLTSGLGAGALGATGIATMIGATKLSWRIFSSANTGVGLTALQKNIREKKDTKKVEKEAETVLNEMQDLPWDKKFNSLKLHLEKKIDGYEKDFQTEKRKNISRKVVGFGSAAAMFFVPTMVREHFFGGPNLQDFTNSDTEKFQHKLAWAKSDKNGLKDYGMGKLTGTQSSVDDFKDKLSNGSESAGKLGNEAKDFSAMASVEKVGEKVVNNREFFSIPKESSIEEELIGQYLKEGKDLKWAQREAHRDVLDWIKEHPELGDEKKALTKMKLVQPNTKIIFDQKTGKILGFEDSKGKPLFGSRLETKTDDLLEQRNEKENAQILEDAKKELSSSEKNKPLTEMDPNDPKNDARNFGEEKKQPEVKIEKETNPSASTKETPSVNISEEFGDKADQSQSEERNWADKIKDRLVPNEKIIAEIKPTEKDWKIADKFLFSHQGKLRELKMLERDNPFFGEIRDETLSNFFQDLYGENIRKEDLVDMQRFVVHNQDNRFGAIYRGFLKEFGEKIVPQKDETMADWSKKLAKLILDKKIKNYV